MMSGKPGKSRMYAICFSTSSIFAVLLFSSICLEYVPSLRLNSDDRMVSNALPVIIAMTFLVIQIYMNRFMLRQRGQEFAQYMLAGLTKNQICVRYIKEYVGTNGKALGMGAGICAIGFTAIMGLSEGSISVWTIVAALVKQLFAFGVVCLLALVFIIRTIRLLSIRELIEQKKMHESYQADNCHFKLHLFLFILSFVICLVGLILFDPYMMSVLSVFIILLIYEGYRLLAGGLQIYRNRLGKGLYRRNRLFLSGQLLSGVKSWIRLSSIVSICCLISLISFVLGIILVQGQINIYDDMILNRVMGVIQIYISVLFTLVIFVVLSIRQTVGIAEHNQQFLIMRSLGKSKNELDRMLITQIAIQFIVPFIMAMLVVAAGILPIAMNIGSWLEFMNIFTGAMGYFFILLLLGAIYVYIIFLTYKRSQKFYIWYGNI